MDFKALLWSTNEYDDYTHGGLAMVKGYLLSYIIKLVGLKDEFVFVGLEVSFQRKSVNTFALMP